ncbi:tRNA (guanosine(18)-2'-O)-methyltransferase isoform X2 [Phoenix dactylifera]|uniref:tRNA (Guanosine(18)-2'-O)-methyltransferase isoform X2 n=1 Tax=Phoenix dactylifera TaxID=42345 RepID=A0A8B8J6N0_PHODC|nr:tRNA (guanosine(18)-2'-O)-methyltransferase isoform X2 [Phoenix dactylifera]
MSACKTLARTSFFSLESKIRRPRRALHSNSSALSFASLPSSPLRFPLGLLGLRFNGTQPYCAEAAVDRLDDSGDSSEDTVEELLSKGDRIERLMKMDRRLEPEQGRTRWFPYLDLFRSGTASLRSEEIIAALDSYILEARKERIRRVVENRSYSVCLVVEGLTDYGNVSAALRSADALGIQSVHVISSDNRKRYRDNRHVSMGAEKWLDIELWNSPMQCFTALRKRGYRIATTHLGNDSVSVYELDWSCPTAIVVGNEHMGISDDALQLSDLHCSIPMKGMVDSFNVSVAAGILMHHAVCDRVSRLV